MIKNYIKDLKLILNTSNFLDDIWIYGNGSFKNKKDKASDLDLIFVYKKKKFEKIKLSKQLKKKIQGSIIYIPSYQKKNIMLFEKLKIFSLKNNSYLKIDINKKFHFFRELTSFVERYYERRKILYSNLKILNDKKIGRIKSLIFSYIVFKRIYNIKTTIEISNLYIRYKNIRKLYVNNKLRLREISDFIILLKKFDYNFLIESNRILNFKFNWNDLNNFQYLFQKKYLFSYDKKESINYTPEIFGYIYTFYSKMNFELSKKIKNDLKCNKYAFKKRFRLLDQYLKMKIKFLNEIYIVLRKNKIKSGIYRFGWYLK